MKPADPTTKPRAAAPLGGRPGLGEVRAACRRPSSGAAGGDERNAAPVPGGVADRMPNMSGPWTRTSPTMPRRPAEVLAADGGGVQARVRRLREATQRRSRRWSAGDAQAEGADEDGGDHEGDGGYGVAGVHRSSTGAYEVAFVARRRHALPAGGEDQQGVQAEAGTAHSRWASGSAANNNGSGPTRPRRPQRGRWYPAQLAAHQGTDVELASRG